MGNKMSKLMSTGLPELLSSYALLEAIETLKGIIPQVYTVDYHKEYIYLLQFNDQYTTI